MLLSAIFLTFLNYQLPSTESIIYRTEEKGKVGYLTAEMRMDDSTIRVYYTSDRQVETVIDRQDLKTLWVRKIINGRKDFEYRRTGDTISVYYQGNENTYRRPDLIFDRHTLDYVLRAQDYNYNFQREIFIHLPELGIKKAILKVVGDTVTTTALGEFDCWRIALIARVLFIKLKLYFLIEKQYPHRYIKYDDGKRKMEIFKYRAGAQ